MGSGCILENNGDNASREPDRESASVTAVAGASLTGSVASSYLGPIKAKNNRLEVGVDVHPRKKFSFSSSISPKIFVFTSQVDMACDVKCKQIFLD